MFRLSVKSVSVGVERVDIVVLSAKTSHYSLFYLAWRSLLSECNKMYAQASRMPANTNDHITMAKREREVEVEISFASLPFLRFFKFK